MLAKGEIVAGYRIEGLLGRGTASTVYRATELTLRRAVALKVIAAGTGDSLLTARVRRAAAMQATLDHPNVLPVYAAHEWQGSVFVVMRLVHGSTLKALIAAGELDPARTLRILRQVANALDAAHGAGFLHGDVTPQNVLVESGDHAYLVDFGLAESLAGAELTRTGQLVGTVDYMAPERVRGERAIAATDIYALGAVLYECLTGTTPFHRSSAMAALYVLLSEPPPPVGERRPELPAALDAVIARALAKDPHERYPTASLLIGQAERAFDTSAGDIVVASRRSEAGEDRHGLRARLRAAALAGVVPEGPARTAREGTWWPPPARAPKPPSQPDPAAYPSASDAGWAMPAEPMPEALPPEPRARAPRSTRSGWWRAARGLLLAAVAGGVGYVILERLLGSALPPLEPAAAGDDVACTVFAPSSAAPGESILVQAFVHLPDQADDARAIAGEMDVEATRRAYRSLKFPVSEGTRLDFELRMPGLDVDDPLASMIWRGSTEAVQFGVRIPAGAPPTVIGTLDISRRLAPLGHVKFKLTIDSVRPTSPPAPQGERARRYSAAFISYASGDRDEVLELVRMLPLVGVRYFQDLLSLEPGDRWIKRLELGIDECDLFLLFWSSEAKRSEWVRHEVRYALARRGGDDLAPPEIKPVILEGPPVIEPWEELAHLHFDDRFRYFTRGGDSGPAA